MNKVILIGNLTKDPEFQTTTNGISICRFTLAVQRKVTNSNGEKEVDFINIITWRGLADNCHKYLAKGKKCSVIGQLQTRTYDAQDGSKRYISEVIAEEIEFLTPRTENEKDKVNTFTPIDDNDLPF